MAGYNFKNFFKDKKVHNSEVFGKYLSVLISKIKEKYGIINIAS